MSAQSVTTVKPMLAPIIQLRCLRDGHVWGSSWHACTPSNDVNHDCTCYCVCETTYEPREIAQLVITLLHVCSNMKDADGSDKIYRPSGENWMDLLLAGAVSNQACK